MNRVVTAAVGVSTLVLGATVVVVMPAPAEGRQPYVNLFKGLYVKDTQSELAKATCNICHLPDRKGGGKDWNYFGLDLKSEMKKQKKTTLTKEILAACIKLRSDNGKTYEANIKAKKLPATK
jgi:hypothetical protein